MRSSLIPCAHLPSLAVFLTLSWKRGGPFALYRYTSFQPRKRRPSKRGRKGPTAAKVKCAASRTTCLSSVSSTSELEPPTQTPPTAFPPPPRLYLFQASKSSPRSYVRSLSPALDCSRTSARSSPPRAARRPLPCSISPFPRPTRPCLGPSSPERSKGSSLVQQPGRLAEGTLSP